MEGVDDVVCVWGASDRRPVVVCRPTASELRRGCNGACSLDEGACNCSENGHCVTGERALREGLGMQNRPRGLTRKSQKGPMMIQSDRTTE